MKIFSSLKGDRIDLNRTKSEGVKGLKEFLNFAEKGNVMLNGETFTDSNLSLVDAVAGRLEDRGFTVKKYIGTSDFKIDIGVVHPDSEKEYILGILIDGRNYYNIETTNDRELLAPNVLKALGWNIYRIWTLDWLKNKEQIIDNIKSEVESILNGQIRSNGLVENQTGEIKNTALNSLVTVEEGALILMKPYRTASLEPISNADSESIYFPSNRQIIKSQMQELIRIEGPISKGFLIKRILRLWNTSRAGSKLNDYLTGVLESIDDIEKTQDNQEFLWGGDVKPGDLVSYRDNSVVRRMIEDISSEEIGIAILELIHTNLSMHRNDLVRLTSRSFGFLKVGSHIQSVIGNAINKLIDQDKLKETNDRVQAVY